MSKKRHTLTYKIKNMPILESIASAALPVIGSVGAAALQRNWALKDWHRTNAYNHPKQQIARLKEAGLPLASMFSGSGGSTSTPPSQSNVDPTLGTAKGMEAYFTNRMQKKQMELIDQQINTETARGETEWKNAGLKANELTLSNDRLQYEINSEGKDTVAPGWMPPSNQVQGIVRDRQSKSAETKAKQITADLLKSKTQAEIDHTLQLNKNLLTQNEIAEIERMYSKFLQGNLGDNGVGILEALIYKFFLRR